MGPNQKTIDVMRDAIERIARGVMIDAVVVGTAVNVTDTVCDVERDDAPLIYGVTLNAYDDALESYHTIVPKEGSTVLVARIEGRLQECVILSCSEIEKIIWKVGDMTLEFTKDGMVMNGGDNGGVPIVSKIDENFDAIKNRFSALETAIATGLSSAAAMDTLAGATFTSTMQAQQLIYKDIENPKVKH